MVSRGHLSPARHAVTCFLQQTYAKRELVVVVDAPDTAIARYLADLDDPRLRLIALPSARRTLGELRNIAVAEARGEYVCQWDDDDLYDPERIRMQLAALRAADAAACLLRRWTLWWPDRQRLAVSGLRLWEGTILARTTALPPYPVARRGEDTAMVEVLASRERIVHLDAPELYTYVHHGGNTFARDHFAAIFDHARERWQGEDYRRVLDQLALRLPIAAYRQDLVPQAVPAAPPRSPFPRVSIIIRSMGRPELQRALQSLARQDYPALEVIVVDATGGRHPPLPELAWRSGHTLHLVDSDSPLNRPRAANRGLDALTGDWFGFLDDDDCYDPDHVSTLMAAAVDGDHLVVYGLTRLIGADGEVRGVTGLPFNRAIMAHGPLHTFPAALVSRRALARGCRFDEAMEISEDRDFFAQIAAFSDFRHVAAATFNYHVEAGTSGTGQGANRDPLRHRRFEQRLRAKWAGEDTYHSTRATQLCRLALRAYGDSGPEAARRLLDRLLGEYPDDPNGLNTLAGILLVHGGDLEAAEDMARRAVRINPAAADYRLTLATILERNGNPVAARDEARAAYRDEGTRAAAGRLLERLPPMPPAIAPAPAPARVKPMATPRLAPCSCGSGRRYKHCCGRPMPFPTDLLDRAERCRQGGQFDQAYALLCQAHALASDPRPIERAVDACCLDWFAPLRRASLIQALGRLHARISAGPPHHEDAGREATIQVIADFAGHREHQLLLETLAAMPGSVLWATASPVPAGFKPISPVPGGIPENGHLIFAGHDFDYGDWLPLSRPSRVTIAIGSGPLDALVARLAQLADLPAGFVLDYLYPSEEIRQLLGLPGDVAGRYIPGQHATR